MQDPIGSFWQIRDNFLKYIRTAFGTRYPELEERRRELFLRPGIFYQEPWIERMPRYLPAKQVSELTLGDLFGDGAHPAGLDEDWLERFREFSLCGLVGDFPLHEHQLEMLKRALRGENLVVTAGTGSGKTEAFLLPIIAQLVSESRNWTEPDPRHAHQDDWWSNEAAEDAVQQSRSWRVSQRVNETRPAAVRAMILYPMNALVEDQVSRLRQALDSGPARHWFQQNLGGNRFYLGRYNGTTPVAGDEYNQNGHRSTDKIQNLCRALIEAQNAQTAAVEYDNENNNGTENVRFFFPAVDAESAEMRSRWDMQNAPPDILVTNFSMLSIMLMREVDAPIFRHTRKWLERNDNAVFNLVFDELHLYRGTAGTEVAYLVRLLLDRLGLDPNSPKLRILGSSASLDQGGGATEEGQEFLRQFFGITEGQRELVVVPGYQPHVEECEEFLPWEPFRNLALAWDEASADPAHGVVQETFSSIAAAFGEAPEAYPAPCEAMIAAMNGEQRLASRLAAWACRDDGGQQATVSLSTFATNMFGLDMGDDGEREKAMQAARGFFIARGRLEFATGNDGEHIMATGQDKMPSFRFHWFFKNIDGLWSSIAPDHGLPVGKLHAGAILQDEHGVRVLETLYCERCGEVFLGGRKVELPDGGGWALVPNDPNLEEAPGNRVTMLSHQATYPEYGIFWPSQGRETELAEHIAANQGGTFSVQCTSWSGDAGNPPRHANGDWIPARLNPYTAVVSQGQAGDEAGVTGFFYLLVPRDQYTERDFRAFSPICPSCGEDYRRRLKDSPIRTFRTGFSKICQVMAKELFQALPSANPGDRKLVVFSDSREDAARLANDIERYHYLELVRDILYNDLRLDGFGCAELLQALVDHANPGLLGEQYLDLNPDEEQNLAALAAALSRTPEQVAALDPDIRPIIEQRRNEGEAILQAAANCCLALAPFTGVEDGVLFRRLLNLGINPAGLEKEVAERQEGEELMPWHGLFDFDGTGGHWRDPLTNAQRQFKNDLLLPKLSQEVSGALFARLYFGFEASGLGHVCINRPNEWWDAKTAGVPGLTAQCFREICHSTIRLLGESFRYNQPVPRFSPPRPINTFDELPGRVRRYVRQVAQSHNLDLENLQQALTSAINNEGHASWLLRIELLSMQLSAGEDRVFCCENCGCIHLHASARVCTNCRSELPATPNGSTCAEIQADHYYVHSGGTCATPFRLHSEELTGQTDDQPQRQRWFRDIVLNGDGTPKLVAAIDLLSVTTTLEVGVDIGALRAVMQGNMPPERFNYQQRAGRGGRRGQAYSFVLTLCRNRSHDEVHFRNPRRITNDLPPVPFLAMGRQELAARLAAKEILRQAFISLGVTRWDGPASSDNHGEFGLRHSNDGQMGWQERIDSVSTWIDDNQVEIQRVADLLTQGSEVEPTSIVEAIRQGLVERISTAVEDPELVAEGLAECLAEGAVLPMYGMPTRTRLLYHGVNWAHHELLAIDRDLDLAVSEFAPGAQKTKDKRTHKAIGFTPPLKVHQGVGVIPRAGVNTFVWGKWMSLCDECRFTHVHDTQGQHYADGTPCPRCGQALREFDARTPAAFRTDLTRGNDAREGEDIVFAPAARLAQSFHADAVDSSEHNCHLSYIERARVYNLNDNKRQYYRGGFGNWGRYNLNMQWLCLDQLPHGINVNGVPEKIALVASKTTDLLGISPTSVPRGLNLDPLRQGASVKAAFASAAFLLRAVVADQLDIDPEELDICHLGRRDATGGAPVGEILISDYHPNGSGFTRWLSSHLTTCLNAVITPDGGDDYASRVLAPLHVEACGEACYQCLKSFRNMAYHSILDWRLAVCVLRILADQDYQCGLDGHFDDGIELTGWPDNAGEQRDRFVSGFANQGIASANFAELPGFTAGHYAVILVHSLWETSQGVGGLLEDARAAALAQVDPDNVRYVDPFNLVRRPSWVMTRLLGGNALLGG